MKVVHTVACLFFSANAFAICPDFSGKFTGKFAATDFRATDTITISQTACSQIDLTETITHKNDSDHSNGNVVWDISENQRDNGWYWNNAELTLLRKDVNTGHCDMRDVFYLKGSDLAYKWRFECTGQNPSAWYTDNVGGIYYRQ